VVIRRDHEVIGDLHHPPGVVADLGVQQIADMCGRDGHSTNGDERGGGQSAGRQGRQGLPEIDSLKLAKLINAKTPRNISRTLTSALEKRARARSG
jgi:hypothetical protein